jgi:hypothetical protein
MLLCYYIVTSITPVSYRPLTVGEMDAERRQKSRGH